MRRAELSRACEEAFQDSSGMEQLCEGKGLPEPLIFESREDDCDDVSPVLEHCKYISLCAEMPSMCGIIYLRHD